MDTVHHRNWWQGMMKNVKINQTAHPNYFATNPEMLETEARLGAFMVGNGEDIYGHICPAIETAQQEVILITCFWARSSSLDMVTRSLRALSDRVIKHKQPKVRVFIGFSSLSALQKLFHTRSPKGKIYQSSQWKKRLWLPDMAELPGLDVQVKSIFVLPFSVMHPKFVIIDRQFAFLPSCNVSWESWFEGCITLSGPVVEQFITFWKEFWAGEDVGYNNTNGSAVNNSQAASPCAALGSAIAKGAAHSRVDLTNLHSTSAVFLPSPHHAMPSFSFPWQTHRAPPPTPLNLFISELLSNATSDIYMQTPNVTSPPVLASLLQALRRGVNVHILTSEKLMILEQLVTAGTTTARCIRKLVKLYKRAAASPVVSDEEARAVPVGRLKVEYYQPRRQDEQQHGEPVQSHLKLTIVDAEWTILGSGNMDRASWYTSQELGVAFKSTDLASIIKQTVHGQMVGRTKLAFDSGTS